MLTVIVSVVTVEIVVVAFVVTITITPAVNIMSMMRSTAVFIWMVFSLNIVQALASMYQHFGHLVWHLQDGASQFLAKAAKDLPHTQFGQ